MFAIIGQACQTQISTTQFSQILQGLNAQLGHWQSVERTSIIDHIAFYKATFDKGTLDFYLSKDSANKVHTFLFKP